MSVDQKLQEILDRKNLKLAAANERIEELEQKKAVSGLTYGVSMLVMGLASMLIATGLFHNIYDWDQIRANQERLEELEERAAVYDTMAEANVGVWCELATHYGWIEEEDTQQAMSIIDSGVHENLE